MSLSGKKNQVSIFRKLYKFVSEYILKENGEKVINNLEQLSRRT